MPTEEGTYQDIIEESIRLEKERQANVKRTEKAFEESRRAAATNYRQGDDVFGAIGLDKYGQEINRILSLIGEFGEEEKQKKSRAFIEVVESKRWREDQERKLFRNNIRRLKTALPFAYSKELVHENGGPIIDYQTLIYSLGLHYKPIEGDGNCFWNAMSWILTGEESQFSQVRANYLAYMKSPSAEEEATIAGHLFEVSKKERTWRKDNKYPIGLDIGYLPKEHAKFIEDELVQAGTKGTYWATEQDAYICKALHGMNDTHFKFRGHGGEEFSSSLRSGISAVHRTGESFEFNDSLELRNSTSFRKETPCVLILNERGGEGADHYAVSPFIVRKYTSTNFRP